MSRDQRLFDAIIRLDLNSFIEKVFYTINPGASYYSNWHIELIAEHLEEVHAGNIKRLIINIPPRSLKSICVSVAWPAWLLGKNPAARIIAASYSSVLSIKHSLDCRFVLESDWYRRIFPEFKLNARHNKKHKFMTSLNGFRFATSVGGSVTGEGGDLLIIDDPHNPIHINSPKQREKIIAWYENSFSSRLNDPKKGAIVLVMQRLHQDDLSAHLLASKNWQLLKIPAIAPEDINYKLKRYYCFNKGEYLNKARDSAEHLLDMQSNIDPAIFASQYMQEPIDPNIKLLSSNDISFWDALPERFDYYCQSWDTAIKVNLNADYSVCTTYGVHNSCLYLISMIRSKMDYPELKTQALRQAQKFRPKFILIEDKASGQSLIQDIRHEDFRIIAVKPEFDKITRFASVVPLFQSGKIKLPLVASFKKDILAEILTFPGSKNDDIVDSISQMLLHYRNQRNKVHARIRPI